MYNGACCSLWLHKEPPGPETRAPLRRSRGTTVKEDLYQNGNTTEVEVPKSRAH